MSPRIRAEGITKRFGPFLALDAVDAAFDGGGICVIAGPNGAGKTTLLRIIAGLLAPSGGRVVADGSIRAGVMMQASYLYRGLTPRENLKLYARLSRAASGRVEEVCRLFELEAFFDHDVATLSHGQKQRASFARAILAEPNLLILDEPFLGLDTASVAHAVGALERFREGGGLALVATHELEIVRRCADRLLVLESGRVTSDGRFNI